MFRTNNNQFGQRDINDVVPEIIYSYLFEGLSLSGIEKKLFNNDSLNGWLSKIFLNYYGIDTNSGSNNRAIYFDRSVKDVVEELTLSSNISHIKVASLLRKKFL